MIEYELVECCPLCKEILVFKGSNYDKVSNIDNYMQIFECSCCKTIFSKFQRKNSFFKKISLKLRNPSFYRKRIEDSITILRDLKGNEYSKDIYIVIKKRQ